MTLVLAAAVPTLVAEGAPPAGSSPVALAHHGVRAEPRSLAAPSQEQGYERQYREGLMAFWGGRWEDAIALLRRAIETQSEAHADPQIRIVGNRTMPYLPHFFVGQANFERGDCRAALAAWEESLRQGVVSGTNLTVLRNRREECFREVAPAMTADVRGLLDRAAGLQEELTALRQQPPLSERWAGEAALGIKEEEAIDQLAQARVNLDEGQVVWGMRMLELAGQQARRGVALLGEVRNEARRILAEEPTETTAPEPDPAVQQAVQEARTKIAAAEEAARNLDPLRNDPLLRDAWASEADLGSRESEAVQQLSAALADMREGEQGGDVSTIADAGERAERATSIFEAIREDAAALREELETAAAASSPDDAPDPDATEESSGDRDAGAGAAGGTTAGREEPDPAPPAVPPRLMDAARILLVERQYDRVITMLEGAENDFRSSRARAHALLLRAAARHALYHLGGERQTELEEAARRDVRACQQADPDLRPPEGYFSPRFLSFFEASRAVSLR